MVKKRNKKLYGVGINDADYFVCYYINGKQVMCPIYRRWKGMLERCYSQTYRKKYPTYGACCVVDSWLRFSNFKMWMEKQDWEGKVLDKDLLVKDNKLYSQDTCIFITNELNLFISTKSKNKITGVFKKNGKFSASCQNPFTTKRDYLGVFTTEDEAFTAWKTHKFKISLMFNESKDNPLIAQALCDMFNN